MDFAGVPVKAVEKHGVAKVAEMIGAAPASLKRKLSLNAFTIRDLQAISDFDPELITLPSTPAPVEPQSNPLGTRLAIIVPSNRNPEQLTTDSIIRMFVKKHKHI